MIAPNTTSQVELDWPYILRSRADASYLKDTEGTVDLLRKAATAISQLTVERDDEAAAKKTYLDISVEYLHRAETAEKRVRELDAVISCFRAWDFPSDIQDLTVKLEAAESSNKLLSERIAVLEEGGGGDPLSDEWEYKTVETGRKSGFAHEDVWPEGDGWEVDITKGRVNTIDAGWDRFDCHEELYFRRKVEVVEIHSLPDQAACIVCDGTGSVLDGTSICHECNGSGKHDDRPGGFDGPTGAD